jgi:glycosyltransferase involved in cell wall biosynthesis
LPGKRKPKILFFIGSLTVGGAESQLTNIAVGLRKRGWPVAVVTILKSTEHVDTLRTYKIPVISLSNSESKPGLNIISRFTHVLNKMKPDILVTFLFHADILGRICGRLAGVKTIISSIRNESFGGSHGNDGIVAKIRELAERHTGFLANAIVVNSSIARERLIENKVIAEQKSSVISNGIDINRFKEIPESEISELRNSLWVNKDNFLWLAAGRIEKQKDYLTLLGAMKIVLEKFPQSRLLIAGHGGQYEQIADKIQVLDLDEQVKLLGVRGDIPALLQAADALILSSLWEGLPNIILEAFCSHLPVVATNVGGIPELIEHSKNGLISSAGEPLALADTMINMMSQSPKKRNALAAVAFRKVEDFFTVDKMINEWENLFIVLLRKKARHGSLIELQ